MLVPVGVKYGALQQTGRTAEDRREVKTFKEKDGKQALTHTHKDLAKA